MVPLPVGGGGVAFYEATRPTNGYLAFPGRNVQVELFSPDGGIRGLISRVRPVSGPAAARAPVVRNGPVTASTAMLTRLETKRGKPVYWLGTRPGRTMELTRSPDGRVYLRYLPAGVAPGAKAPYLTVATYPLANAFAATRATSVEKGMVRVPVSGGAIAFYSRSRPTSVYLSFPGSNEQIELFDPSPSVVHALAAKVTAVP
jgi:hypothetical protein